MSGDCQDRVYQNAGNPALLELLGDRAKTILDVGCGAGDNAALLGYRDTAPTTDEIRKRALSD